MKGITKEELAVAKAWAKGNISHAEATRLLKRSSVSTYVVLARALRVVVQSYAKK